MRSSINIPFNEDKINIWKFKTGDCNVLLFVLWYLNYVDGANICDQNKGALRYRRRPFSL